MTRALGDRPEWFDGVTYGVSLRVGRRILDLEAALAASEARADYWQHKGDDGMSLCAKVDPGSEGYTPERAVQQVITILTTRAELLAAECVAWRAWQDEFDEIDYCDSDERIASTGAKNKALNDAVEAARAAVDAAGALEGRKP